MLVHAGIPFFWTAHEAMAIAKNTSNFIMQDPSSSIAAVWGNKPRKWSNELNEEQQARFAINCFTRMRFINMEGALDLNNTSAKPKKGFNKWFDVFDFDKENVNIVFGHWASLNGKTKNPLALGLDTGCVWGNKLTALRLEDQKKFSVKVIHEDL